MNRTKIEWVRNPDGTQGYTWNPITGCLGPIGTPDNPQRCPYCYAHRLARGRLKRHYLSNFWGDKILLPNGDPMDPFIPRFWPNRLDEPFRVRKPNTIFVCSMGEPFNQYYPFHWLENIFDIFWQAHHHTFIVLTKNPEGARQRNYPKNVWLGVTVSSFRDWRRVCSLQDGNTEAYIKFISFEPLLDDALDTTIISLNGIDWVIIGAQTKPTVLPKAKWIFRVIDRANKEGIPIFLKNNLKPVLGENLRQEFPSRGRKPDDG